MTGLAGEGYLAIVESHNLGDIVESDTESFHVVDVASGDAVEFLENMFLVFLGYADAVVGDLDDGETVVGMGGNVNKRSIGGVFDGVVDKIVNHVGNVQFVGKEHAVDGLEVGGEGALAVFDSEFETLDGVADDVVEVDLFGRDGEFLA